MTGVVLTSNLAEARGTEDRSRDRSKARLVNHDIAAVR